MPLDLESSLSRKIGPLPAWGYGAIIAGGLWAVYLWKKRQAKPQTDVFSQLGFGAGTDAGTIVDTGVDSEDLNPSGTSGGGSVTPAPGPPTTNAAWFTLVLELLADGYGYDRQDVVDAMHAYLNGQSLSVGQWGMVLLAKARYGAPPEGVASQPSTPATPAPTPAPAPAPAPAPSPQTPTQVDARTVTITPWPTKLSTMWGVAETFYGNGASWPTIWNDSRNASIVALRGRPEYIRTGDIFVVP